MFLITVAVVTTCVVGLVHGQSPSCVTPDGMSGECIKISQCQPILELLSKPMKTDPDLMLLRSSHCGVLQGVRKVCCPKVSESEPVQSINGSCNTPDGRPGTCVGLHSCPHIENLLIPPVPQENIDFVRNSKCNSPEQYPVCCGPHLEERPMQTSDCTRMTAFPPDSSSQCCGLSGGFGIRIRDGDPTSIEDHPWTVIIEYRNKKYHTMGTYCGGALISGKYVLTAAHCITGPILERLTPKIVRLGEYNIQTEGQDCVTAPGGGQDCTDGAIRIAIERTIPHPMYDRKKSNINDFGLIRLKETAPYTDFIRPVCLPTKDLTRPENTPPSFWMYAVGWGATKFGSPQSDIKLHVKLPFVSHEKCQPIYHREGRSITLARSQLCAGGIGHKDACNGDSGGPLVYENKGQYELIGIVSFGPTDCGQPGVPGIYSNVYEYLDWIKSVIVA